jgi:hypothetical protein
MKPILTGSLVPSFWRSQRDDKTNTTPYVRLDLGHRRHGMIGTSSPSPGKHGRRGRTAKSTLSRPLRRAGEADATYAERLRRHSLGTFSGSAAWAVAACAALKKAK